MRRIHWPALTPLIFAGAGAALILLGMLCSQSCTPAETMHAKIRRVHSQDQMAQAIADSANYSIVKPKGSAR